ncbi:phosphatidylserine decarboxylase [Armillaria gallica]|uniref:Phosphatidylserine decarboxylase n=1 Tax=Armillaria gallica TaxID=47427 RepID=A0A2H3DHI3_ARMGA|nr:phosphatidylserine decarboxylase [Armillaria gallica]
MSQPEKTTLTGYGGWIPVNVAIYESFIQDLIQLSTTPREAHADHTAPVAKFEVVIKADPEMVDLWDQIFLQDLPKNKDSPKNKIVCFDQLLYMMDDVIVAPPRFYLDEEDKGEPIGVPLYLLFDLFSNTAAGHDLFRKQAFNAAMKDLLDAWGTYLMTPDSNKTLTDADDGWFSSAAIAVLEDKDRGKFNATYVCPDPDAVNRGFTSWDEFFTRKVQAEARPVDVPEDKTLIHNACESTVYRTQTGVKEHDQFWLKGQPYSVYDMLNRDSMAKIFIGGTVYQAFLSPQDYHRWHSPVDGTIIRTQVIPGTYYAVLPDAGAEVGDPDLKPGDPRGAMIRSQAWLTLSATRAIIYILADNPVIGLVAFIGVGMVEVSTCAVSVKSKQRVSVGDELGMFHFGGSSHALIFGPQVRVTFADNIKVNQHVKVKSIIAQASLQVRPVFGSSGYLVLGGS